MHSGAITTSEAGAKKQRRDTNSVFAQGARMKQGGRNDPSPTFRMF